MQIIERIQNIGLPEKQFVVMGSANLEVKGIRKAKDIDIMVKKDLFDELRKDSSWEYFHKVGRLGDEREGLKRGEVDLYHSVWGREDFDYFFSDLSRIELIDGIYFVSLKNLLEAKSGHWDRGKDRKDAELIKEYLARK
ncbi:MAG: hypothetical protein ISR99_01935 [Parcubacteria group bacterium]|nr:hypothetical protein [Parcubacteria group bacterium]